MFPDIIPPTQARASAERLLVLGNHNLPLGFDPQQHPVIAEHWFGFRPIGAIIPPIVRRFESLQEAADAPV